MRNVCGLLFLLYLALPVRAQNAPTLETLLRAVQERHMVLEKRDAIGEINTLQLQDRDFQTATNFLDRVTLEPIEWGVGIDPYPGEESLAQATMEERVRLTARASEELDRVKRSYLNVDTNLLAKTEVPDITTWNFREKDLPGAGGVDPVNYRRRILELSAMATRLKMLKWAPMKYSYFCGNGNGYIDFSHVLPWDAYWIYWDGDHTIPSGIASCSDASISMNSLFPHGQDAQAWFESKTQADEIGYFGGTVDGPARMVFDGYFFTSSEGFLFKFETLPRTDDPRDVQGTVYQLDTWEQHIVYGNPASGDDYRFFPQHPGATPPGRLLNQGLAPAYLQTDPLVMGSEASKPFSEGTAYDPLPSAYMHGLLAYVFYWDPESNEDPEDANGNMIVGGDDPRWLKSEDHGFYELNDLGRVYHAEYDVAGVMLPDFRELTQPVNTHTLGPGDTGHDGPTSVWDVNRLGLYRIGLGDGLDYRGTQGELVLSYAFAVGFRGDRGQYLILEHTEDRQVYKGSLVETEVEKTSETTWTITQKLIEDLPDQMGNSDETLKTFVLTDHSTAPTPLMKLECTYHLGADTEQRTYLLRYQTLTFGDSLLSPPMEAHGIFGGGTRSLHLDGEVVQSRILSTRTVPERFGPEHLLVTTNTWHAADGGQNDRVLEILYHDNGIPQQVAWTGPGAGTATFDVNGTLLSSGQTTGPFSSSSPGASGNLYATTSRHGADDLRTSVYQRVADDEFTLTDLLPTDGTSTTVHLWDPADAGTPSGQVPWGVRRVDHPDGTVTLISDLLTATGRTHTDFQGTADASGNEIEGVRTVTKYNRLGGVTSSVSTWRPDGLILSSESFTQSRLGPTGHEDTDGFDTTFGWNAAGEPTGSLGRSGGFSVEDRDAIGRITELANSLTGAGMDLTPNGTRLDFTRTAGAASHTGHSEWNAFGEMTESGYDGAQEQTSSSGWSGDLWSGGGDNLHTHAGATRTFNESSLESLIRSKTAPGMRTTVAYEALSGTPCLRIDAFAVQPGLTGGVEKPVSKTFIDGLGRIRRESAPDPSQAGLAWRHTDYHYDDEGRLERIDRPADPDLLFEHDSLSRPWRRVIDLNNDGEIQVGADAVFETTYGVENGKWVEETGIWLTGGTKKILSREESDAVARSFSQQIGARAADTMVASTPAPGQTEVKLNNRVVFQLTPTSATLTDDANDEADPMSRIETTLSALGVPLTLEERDGPMTRNLSFNASADPVQLSDAGINSDINLDYDDVNEDGSYNLNVTHGALDGPTIDHDPGASTTDVGGGGGMPHVTGLDWSPANGWKQTLSLAGGDESEWHINPAGLVTKKVHANDDEFLFTYDSAGRKLTETTPAGGQIWTYDDLGGVESWTVVEPDQIAVIQFDVTQTDLLGRPKRIVDASGTRGIEYDNDKWTLDTVEWIDGKLKGFKLDEDADTRGRLETLTVSNDLADLYTVSHTYRGESDRIDTMTISSSGAPAIEIDVNGDGGVADDLVYKIGGQTVFTYSRSRNVHGRLNGITAPGFSQSWTLDNMGRIHQLTTDGKTTTYGYDPDNGSLASAISPDEIRIYDFNDRGELEEEIVDGEALWATEDPNQSGAIAGRENLRELKIYGTFHPNAVVEILAGTNVVHNTAVTPFAFTFDDTTLPALADTNAVVSLNWSVIGTRPEEPGGTPYEGGNAVAEVAGNHLFAPQAEAIQYDIASRRASDAFLNYGWDAANQPLMLEERHGPHRTEHEYDGSQRRVEKRVYHNGNLRRTHRFVYDGWLPVVEEVLDQWGNPDYRNLYVWGPGPDGARRPGLGATGQLALIIHQPKFGPPQLSAPVYNHRLDLVSLIDVETGNVVARYGYTPFGETTYAVGSRAEQNPFRFAGAYDDPETGSIYFGYRHYHPRTKSWISRDPIGEAGGLNLFAYCNNDPINGVDVLGLKWMVFDGVFWKAYGSYAWNEGPIGGLREWRRDEAIPAYTQVFTGEVTVGEIFKEGVPAAHGLAVDNVAQKTAIRQSQGNSFAYSFFQSAISDPVLGGVGVLPIMEGVAGYDSLSGEDISTADRFERAGMGVFRIGATGALMAGAYNPNATFSSSLGSLNYTGTGFAGARTWATTYRPLALNKEWLTTFRINNNTPVLWSSTSSRDTFTSSQMMMLQKNVGYNISPESWFSRYPALGREGTFLTNYRSVAKFLGPVRANQSFSVGLFPGQGQISYLKAWRLERALGLERGSLMNGFRFTRIPGIMEMAPRSPLFGNKYFLGPGEGLPGGGPEMVVDPFPTTP